MARLSAAEPLRDRPVAEKTLHHADKDCIATPATGRSNDRGPRLPRHGSPCVQDRGQDYGTWLLEATGSSRCAAVVARALVNPKDGEVPGRLLNLREETVSIHKGTKVADLEEVQAVSAANIEVSETKRPTAMISQEKQEL